MDYSQMPSYAGAPVAAAQAAPAMSPQQKLAMALMQQPAPAIDNSGRMSPLQGLSQIGNKMMAMRMMQQQPQQTGQLGNNVSPFALQNANASQDPLGTLAMTQGWNQ